jgi:uncharacterized Fe-S cluster-containing radical SAM superfamily enzyme
MIDKHTGKPVFRIKSGIPLIGHIAFGLIDRGTNLIQCRPTSGCNLNCIYCAVDEGPYSRARVNDFYVDCDYIIEGFKKLAGFKGADDIEAHIDSVGEPMIYDKIPDFIRGIRNHAKTISMQSNGTLLDKGSIKKLESAGLNRINLSINATDAKLARKLAGTKKYDVEHVKKIAMLISESKIQLLLAPVWLPGFNDDETEKLVVFGKELDAQFGFQNFLRYKMGRRCKIKQQSMFNFKKMLEKLEKKHDVQLRLRPADFNIHKCKSLPIPFKKGEKALVRVVAPGRKRKEVIAKARERCITVIHCNAPIGAEARVRILSTKHNIFLAEPVI